MTDTFGGSVWASVPRLVALEKNYTEEELDEKTVDLGKQALPSSMRLRDLIDVGVCFIIRFQQERERTFHLHSSNVSRSILLRVRARLRSYNLSRFSLPIWTCSSSRRPLRTHSRRHYSYQIPCSFRYERHL